ncbi:hypothetical protein JXB11_03605 [Candidatus Woesearchaeota archaeon]|nr:hypothetical protein [Candidatus Woesearchaeota archaeon]
MNPLMLILAFADFFAAVALLLLQYDFFPAKLALGAVAFLLLKGFLFFGDVASKADLIIGAYLLISILLDFHIFLHYVFAIYFVQKAILSLF